MIHATRYHTAVEIARQARLSADIGKLQASISSGKRISAPSDDPVASGRVSEIRQTQADQATWLRNIDTGASLAGEADDRLGAVATVLDRAKELILKGRNEASSDLDRSTLAVEIRGLAEDIKTYAAQTDSNGRSIFPLTMTRAIPVSDQLSLSPTMIREDIFDKVPLAAGDRSIVDILGDAVTALTNTAPVQRATDLSTMLDTLDVTSNHIADIRADQGVRAARFDDAKERLANTGEVLAGERSSLEDTDLSSTIADFQSKKVALDAAQAVFAKTNKSTLFDLLG